MHAKFKRALHQRNSDFSRQLVDSSEEKDIDLKVISISMVFKVTGMDEHRKAQNCTIWIFKS